MFFRKFIHSVLLACFLGALALTTLPHLHERQHHSAAASHSEDAACKVCQILGHFVSESATAAASLSVPGEFFNIQPAFYQTPHLQHLHSALIPRAPPAVG